MTIKKVSKLKCPNRWFAVVHSKGQTFRSWKNVQRITAIVWTTSALISSYRIPLMNTVIITSNKNFSAHNSTNFSNFSVHLKASNITKSTKISNDDFEMCMFFYGKYGISEDTKILANCVIETLGPLIGFVIPILIISFCYANIVSTVRRKTMETSSRAPVGRVTKLSTMVITAFVICWTPQKVLNLWSAFCGWLNLCPFDETAYNQVYPFCLVLAWTNSIMNPILYALTTPTVRKNLAELVPFLKIRPHFRTIRSLSTRRRTDSTRQHSNHLQLPLCSCAQQQARAICGITATPEIVRNLREKTKLLRPGDGNRSS